MDHLPVSEDKKSVCKIKNKLSRFLALVLSVCLVFLAACAKHNVSQTGKLADEALSESVVGKTSSPDENVTSALITTDESDESTKAGVSGTSSGTSENGKTSEKSSVKSSDKTTANASGNKATQKTSSQKKTSAPKTTDSNKKTTAKATVPTTKYNGKYCYLSIDCKTVLENMNKLDSAKKGVVPNDGIILKKTKIPLNEGDNVYDVLKRACQNNVCSHKCSYCSNGRIQFESVVSAFGVYIRGIHYLYEKDCGTHSGWMYKVNGVFPSVAVDLYEVKENDLIEFVYTCNLNDTGSSF